ncbi:MAG TPA: HetZ-related protein 2 [Halomicronema sp.]
MKLAEKIAQDWKEQLVTDYPNLPENTRQSIINWLIGENPERFESLDTTGLNIAKSAMNFRYQILRQRYLSISSERAYRNLIQRLGSLVMLRQKIRTWVALSRDRQRTVVDVLQEVIQEMLQADRYLQQQMAWIASSTSDTRLRNALLLATTEEYCLRPIRNQPLLVYRFVNYLRRTQRGGLTQVPAQELIRLISEEVTPSDTDAPLSLLDTRVLSDYQDNQATEERQILREAVCKEFEVYLAENIGQEAVEWLRLYLKGCSQEVMAQKLNLPVKQLYRLREKVSYHAIRVFALKIQPELVGTWLEISLSQHSLGLTPTQWKQYCEQLTPIQHQLIELLKASQPIESICQILNLKKNQVISEWTKLYLLAQNLRNSSMAS